MALEDLKEMLAIRSFNENFNKSLASFIPPYIPTDITSEIYLKNKYEYIYKLLKVNLKLGGKLVLKFRFDKEDKETQISISSPSFRYHVDIENPKFESASDSKKKVLRDFKKKFK